MSVSLVFALIFVFLFFLVVCAPSLSSFLPFKPFTSVESQLRAFM